MLSVINLAEIRIAQPHHEQPKVHHIHWKYFSASEFHFIDRQDDEYYNSFAEAKARVQELILNWTDYDFTLDVVWYDGNDTGEPYRRFHVCSPDRG